MDSLFLFSCKVLLAEIFSCFRDSSGTENLRFEVESQTKALREQTEIAITLRGQAEEAKLESDRLRVEAEQHADG